MVAQTIQFIIAPVVMVSTCAIVLGSLLGRYAFLNERLRTLAQEHWNLQQDGGNPAERYDAHNLGSRR
jgi:hypothetical protein